MQTKKEQQFDTIQRNARVPKVLDEWLERKTAQDGYRSVPDLIVQLIREARERELTAQEQQESALAA